MSTFVRAASLQEVRERGCLPVTLEGRSLALFADGDRIFAVDNRCPHMGFPLHRGTVRDGILTCHWHHARFDLCTGGTFDLWADDARVHPVEVRGEEVWVDPSPRPPTPEHLAQRVRDGLERNLPLVLAKAVLAAEAGSGRPGSAPTDTARVPDGFRLGVEFGCRHREAGWGSGLTMLTAFANLADFASPATAARCLHQGLSAVAEDAGGVRFPVRPLPGTAPDPGTFRRWFRRMVELRDAEGAERCLATAVQAGADRRALADMLFAAATDHRYLSTGHVLDFTNKALEALDRAGWDLAEPVLGSLARSYAEARRMEESASWRQPVDLAGQLEQAFDRLEPALENGRDCRGAWAGDRELQEALLGDSPPFPAMLEALAEGASEEDLAVGVTHAAALRLARFPVSNEFGDWDTALHTFTFANAVHQGLRRLTSPEDLAGHPDLLRGVFDAAASVWLDRFLNVPPAPLPEEPCPPEGILEALGDLLDRRQEVDRAGGLVAGYLLGGGGPDPLLARMVDLLVREDRDFHTIQAVEAAVQQYRFRRNTPEGVHVMVAGARYLAAHAATHRAQESTWRVAERLARGDRLY